ncbi:flagellar protein FliS [Erythrobacter sp. CCH5-A1]|jgi:flagellin-specific chaperone FliS|uniref:flagellar protein FliS n=1 Tax=Erythrobacter sp. CCH5-A1 TaxID=1768792 RepID=UPI00082B9C31|nr:flagellar protein FliS [Erythrobacter sp. CCH5-A1]
MQMLSRNPAAAYRRVTLEARIEASGSGDLTRICLEEAQAALGHALIALERGAPPPREPLTRAQTILLWLAKSVAPEHPLGASLKAFYGGLAGQLGAQILQADARMIAEIRMDISDLLEAAG